MCWMCGAYPNYLCLGERLGTPLAIPYTITGQEQRENYETFEAGLHICVEASYMPQS